jgi:hypothetical protein
VRNLGESENDVEYAFPGTRYRLSHTAVCRVGHLSNTISTTIQNTDDYDTKTLLVHIRKVVTKQLGWRLLSGVPLCHGVTWNGVRSSIYDLDLMRDERLA